eukprot:376726_1
MATIESLKKQLMSQQDDLIQQLETIYINFIMKLLQQKKQIIQKMQQLFHKQIEKLYTIHSSDTPQSSILDPSFICEFLTSLLQTKKPALSEITQFLGHCNQNITKVHISNIDKKSTSNSISANTNKKIIMDTKTIQTENRNINSRCTKTMTNHSVNTAINTAINTAVNSINNRLPSHNHIHRYQKHYNHINHSSLNRSSNRYKYNHMHRTLRVNNLSNNAFGPINNIHSAPHKISRETQTNPIDYGMINGSNYASLMKSKTGSFECKHCGKFYKHLCNLKTHQKVHTNDCYICQFCDKRFGRKYNYTEHVRIHTGETPFECTMCRKRFKQKHGLKNHMKKLHQCNF